MTGRRVDCSCPRATHRHGTPQAYKVDGCRCAPCQAARKRNDYRLAREKAAGTYCRRQPPGPLATELRELMESRSLSLRAVSRATGVPWQALSRILSDDPPAYVRASTVAAVRAFRDADLAPTVLVPAVGTVRRLRALTALGWPANVLAEALDMSVAGVLLILDGPASVQHRTSEKVDQLYAQLSMRPPKPRDRYQRSVSTRTRNRALVRGWVPPLAWDDESIDDATAEPLDVVRAA